MFKNLIKGHADKLCNTSDEASVTLNTTLVYFILGPNDTFHKMEDCRPVPRFQ
jgi:hypothetical protein